MNWDDVLARLKDARTWVFIMGAVNAALAFLKVDAQVVAFVDSVVALIALLLFGVEPVLQRFYK